MTVSLILPTLNAGEPLSRLLDMINSQTYLLNEIIIIDSSSKDDTVDIAREYTENIIIIPQSEFDHGGTRTIAAKAATGEILVFLTQDALPYDNKTIENILKPFDDPEVGAVYGRQIPYTETSPFGKHLREFNYPKTSHARSLKDKDQFGIKTAFLSNSFAAYRCDALEKIGWFRDGMIFGEDMYAGAKFLQEGYKIAYQTDAKVYHSHSYTVLQEFKRYFDMGVFHANEAWLLKDFGKPEGEGKRFVFSEWTYLVKEKKYLDLFQAIFRNSIKLFGYKLGKIYQYLPQRLCMALSMNKQWWGKETK